MESIFWHDYETFGADPQKDRPCQFAGVRTDLELNIIEDPKILYCVPSEDFLPSPTACLITKITPQVAKQNGLLESEFAEQINAVFSQPGTCVAGYNSIRFDDEVSRNLFYRNLMDPYEREWRSGNSRWDLIDVVRLVHVMRPDTLEWPRDEEGNPSFRLELLTKANGIAHEAAHDAMSDVYATIALAKLIKQRQPKLFDWAFSFRNKDKVANAFDITASKPLLHVSSKYKASLGCCAIVAPLFQHPKNKNGVVVWDLRFDPADWLEYDVEDLKKCLYMSAGELPSGMTRPPLKTVHTNKCPILLPASSLKEISDHNRLCWQLDEAVIKNHLQGLRKNVERMQRWSSIFSEEYVADTADPDLMIYSGGFFSPQDKKEMARARSASVQELAEFDGKFTDPRLPEMLFRYKARNYPEALSDEEQEKWNRHCFNRVVSGEGGFLNLEGFAEELNALCNAVRLSESDAFILEELKLYAESIVPYD